MRAGWSASAGCWRTKRRRTAPMMERDRGRLRWTDSALPVGAHFWSLMMTLPTGALAAAADGETLSLFRNTGHNLDIQLKPLATPEIRERLSGAPGRRSSD